ncbi:50S ribosomal protein L34e [Candidatus Woesearchaeota archaeon]|nr:50S ribosomal protein L34e [Candidatus Woesearchaeota archaeon]
MKARRSRSYRRIRIRVPSGETRLFYKKRKPHKAKCSICGDVLKGVFRGNVAEMRNIAKTKKRPERPYGGALCSSCMRKAIVEKVRSELK